MNNADEYLCASGNHVKEKLRIDVATVYELMESLIAQDYLSSYLQIHCSSCQKYTGYCYKMIGEIPAEIFCPNCIYADTYAINYAIVVYRVDLYNVGADFCWYLTQ